MAIKFCAVLWILGCVFMAGWAASYVYHDRERTELVEALTLEKTRIQQLRAAWEKAYGR